VPANDAPPPASDYRTKTLREAAQTARRATRTGPEPFGDPLSGILLVAEPAAGAMNARVNARVVDALRRSLATVKLDAAYVTWPHSDLLEEILSLEPGALVAVGSAAARAIDSLNNPLARASFSEAPEGSWFAWTKGTSGLRLPALALALKDEDAKRRFWRAFLALRVLASEEASQHLDV
jgi:hypothetical protein